MSMLDKAFFVSPEVFTRSVELPDGSKHDLHFKQVSAVEFRRFRIAENSDNETARAESIASLIAASLCDENGKAAITRDEATQLTGPAANAIFTAVIEINRLGDKQEGNA